MTPQQKHKAFKSHLLQIQSTHWNPMNVYEPVGATVLLLMANHEILMAKRENIVESKDKLGVYFRNGIEVTGKIIGWAYH